jgi:hypothetical protein
MSEAEAARATLRALDRLLAEAPPCTAQDGMEAVRRAVAWRDALVAGRRAQGASAALDRRLALANGVLGLVWSGVVPVAGFRRERLETARAALAAETG